MFGGGVGEGEGGSVSQFLVVSVPGIAILCCIETS